uniref:F-box domain-containing protein n=1 Tax=Mycena chlorophos TaxID=658473 RepID=A0ABQ0LBZ6_MYCCL|nr:predicted protein [Mycena chlorophos]
MSPPHNPTRACLPKLHLEPAKPFRTIALVHLSREWLAALANGVACAVEFPILQSVTLIPTTRFPSDGLTSWTANLFSNTPSLRVVKVDEMWTRHLNIAWGALTVFEYFGANWSLDLEELKRGLSQMHALRKCCLTLRLSDPPEEPDTFDIDKPLLHPSLALEDLYIAIEWQVQDMDRFFSTFTFPALHRLYIGSRTTQRVESVSNAIPAFLKRSNAPLKRLALDSVEFSYLDLFSGCSLDQLEDLALLFPDPPTPRRRPSFSPRCASSNSAQTATSPSALKAGFPQTNEAAAAALVRPALLARRRRVLESQANINSRVGNLKPQLSSLRIDCGYQKIYFSEDELLAVKQLACTVDGVDIRVGVHRDGFLRDHLAFGSRF